MPLAAMTAHNGIHNYYDLMDSAYDDDAIKADSRARGHVPIIDVNPRRNAELKADIERKARAQRTLNFPLPEQIRYNQRSSAERTNSQLKDNYGGNHVRVRGHAKVFAHLCFGVLCITATQIMRFVT